PTRCTHSPFISWLIARTLSIEHPKNKNLQREVKTQLNPSVTIKTMQIATTLKLAVLAAPVLLSSAAGWSVTLYSAANCDNATIAAASSGTEDKIEKSGDVACEAVPNADRHKSILGAIPEGSACRISLYPREGCGDRVAFALTQYTTSCLSIEDFVTPLAYYKASDCA
ncbi:hypothetical protein M426DRAFT_265116, partial [Hypoxylon sp. CI-4A]